MASIRAMAFGSLRSFSAVRSLAAYHRQSALAPAASSPAARASVGGPVVKLLVLAVPPGSGNCHTAIGSRGPHLGQELLGRLNPVLSFRRRQLHAGKPMRWREAVVRLEGLCNSMPNPLASHRSEPIDEPIQGRLIDGADCAV